jgi:voltage-gated potassium channel
MQLGTISYKHARREIARRLWRSAALLCLVVLIGTAGYQVLEDWDFLDSLYMTVITVTTIGLGEVRPLDQPGRWFTIFISLAGVGTVAYALSSVASMVVGGELFNIIKGRQMEKDIKKLSGHIILCGAGNTGQRTLQEFLLSNKQVVVIEQDPEVCDQLNGNHVYVITGNATDEGVLEKANIRKAAGLITSLPEDADNVFVTLTARELAPGLDIVSRASDKSIEKKLLHAGATRVVVVDEVGGRHMANIMLHPYTVKLVDEITGLHNREIGLREIVISEGCAWSGKTPGQLNIRANTGLSIVGLINPDGRLTITPPPDMIMQPGAVLIVFGPVKAARDICRQFGSEV